MRIIEFGGEILQDAAGGRLLGQRFLNVAGPSIGLRAQRVHSRPQLSVNSTFRIVGGSRIEPSMGLVEAPRLQGELGEHCQATRLQGHETRTPRHVERLANRGLTARGFAGARVK